MIGPPRDSFAHQLQYFLIKKTLEITLPCLGWVRLGQQSTVR